MEAPRMRYNPRVAPYDRFAESPRGPYGMPRAPPPFRRGPEWEDYYFRGSNSHSVPIQVVVIDFHCY